MNNPILFGVPIEQWHHDEQFRVKNSQDCLVVYELLAIETGLVNVPWQLHEVASRLAYSGSHRLD